MEIIPVIDLLGGIVVHAQGGKRDQYKALTSILTDSYQPENLVRDLLKIYPFKTIYLADLDAIILGKHTNQDVVRNLAMNFPSVQFWLDAGICNREDWERMEKPENVVPVLGSESLDEIDLLTDNTVNQRAILSLDFRDSTFLGKNVLLENPDLWTPTVIVMNLDVVGADIGPDLPLVSQLRQWKKNIRWVGAGGVRSAQDLEKMQQEGISAALVASALHTGSLPVDVITEFNK